MLTPPPIPLHKSLLTTAPWRQRMMRLRVLEHMLKTLAEINTDGLLSLYDSPNFECSECARCGDLCEPHKNAMSSIVSTLEQQDKAFQNLWRRFGRMISEFPYGMHAEEEKESFRTESSRKDLDT